MLAISQEKSPNRINLLQKNTYHNIYIFYTAILNTHIAWASDPQPASRWASQKAEKRERLSSSNQAAHCLLPSPLTSVPPKKNKIKSLINPKFYAPPGIAAQIINSKVTLT